MRQCKNLKKTCLALAISQLMALPTQAATVTVTSHTDNGSGGCTLREAIASIDNPPVQTGCVNSGAAFGTDDTIEFGVLAENTINLTSQLSINKDLILNGPGEDNLTIKGGGVGRVIYVGAATVDINDVTISGGSISVEGGNFGGGVFAVGASLTISNTTISGNTANGGGGVAADSSTIVLNDCTITDNSGGGLAGGLFAYKASEIELNNCVIEGNSAGTAAGMQIIDSNLTMDSSRISNSSAVQGGGLIVTMGGTATISNSSIVDNSATNFGGVLVNVSTVSLTNSLVSGNTTDVGSGGGVRIVIGTLNLDGSTISNNFVPGSGGGIYALGVPGYLSYINLNDSTIFDNSAGDKGGGIYATSTNLMINNSTVSGNTASGYGGGGMHGINSDLNLNNSTFSGNSGAVGGGIYAVGSNLQLSNNIASGNLASTFGQELSLNDSSVNLDQNNLFGESSHTLAQAIYVSDGIFTPDISDIIASSDSVDAAPLASIIGPLGDNGGSTFTHLPTQDGLVIDSGDNTACALAPISNLDQRGQPRPSGANCDIGAVEFQPSDRVNESSFFVVPLQDGSVVVFEL